jgi:hypothetical protein
MSQKKTSDSNATVSGRQLDVMPTIGMSGDVWVCVMVVAREGLEPPIPKYGKRGIVSS